MSKEKLNNLIDKVVGKVGPLRVPAYWMNKLFKDIVESISDIVDRVDKKVAAKADKMPIKSFSSSYVLKPNVYTTYTISSYGRKTINLDDIADPSTYNEYIIEIKCTYPPSSVVFADSNNTEVAIKWANGISPIFEAGNTYLISIVNGYGLYTKF